VDRGGVGQLQFVQVARAVRHDGCFAAVGEVDVQRLCLGVDGHDLTDVAVEDIEVVVVARLHDLVARGELLSSPGDALA